ncbi:MAG: carboxypeptidase-like regulatory domain-containing protein [Siphonobacter sp.]
MSTQFVFQSSPWWIPLSLVVGSLYAFLLYQPKTNWSKTANWSLAALRFLVVSTLCFLLLNILLRQTETRIEKKTVVLAIDNSVSVGKAGQNLITGLKNLQTALAEKGYATEIQTLQEKPVSELDSVQFTQKTTNLAGLLANVKSNLEGRNVTDVILLSDGIVNQGASPTYTTYTFPVHTIAVGDTTPKRDINLKSVFANQIAYLGNQFPIQAGIVANGYSGQMATVVLRQNGQTLSQQTVRFPQNQAGVTVNFVTQAKTKGVQRLSVQVVPLAGEHTTQNNQKDIYVEVIDGRQKILMLASAPHPDIKAFRSIIEKNDNFEFQFQLVNATTPAPTGDQKYDLLILHQLPESYSSPYLKKLLDGKTPCFWIVGSQTNINQLNNQQQVAQLLAQSGQTDQVTPYFNKNFNRLNFDQAQMELLRKMPPVSVPFGDIQLIPNTEVILYQKKNTLETNKPLLLLNTGLNRGAILLGEGMWQWRLEEYQMTEKQEVVDELFTKIIQYLAAKDDKRKLRVYPIQNLFQIEDQVVFETEIYNDIYERIYGPEVNLTITDERGQVRKYTYTSATSRFEISNLPVGMYQFTATAKVLGKTETATGQFVVRDEQLELANTTADYNLLRQLSQQTSGKFVPANQLASLQDALLARNLPDRMTSTEDLREAINLRWIFFVLLALLSIEWGVRKYLGGY